MQRLTGFGRFWYDFIVGDDWRLAIGVVVALAITGLLVNAGVSAWWVLPAVVGIVLGVSVAMASGRRT